jgi:CO dehydrogenase maturation factor
MTLKLAVSGKGGVGKTTVSAMLAVLYGQKGRLVLAVDADPSPNLASALGIPRDVREKVTPLSQMLDLIEERTGVRPGLSYGSIFRLNPQVDDLVDKYGVRVTNNVRLLVLGSVESGGSGCFCPENALLRRLMKHIVLDRDEVLIMDMEAGVEHLGRGTAEGVDIMLIVVEPGLRSVETASRIKALAEDVGIKNVAGAVNKVRSEDDLVLIRGELEKIGVPCIGSVMLDPGMVTADLNGLSPMEMISRETMESLEELAVNVGKYAR